MVVLVVDLYICVGCILLVVFSLCLVISVGTAGVKLVVFVCIYLSAVVVPVVCSIVLYSQ